MNIKLRPREVLVMLLCIIATLLALHSASLVVTFNCKHNNIFGLIPLFNFDVEANIPTFYSAIALLFSSVLFATIAILHRKYGASHIPWLGLAIIFLFLSIDEIGQIHEALNEPLKAAKTTSELFFYAWIIPYGFGVVLLALAYLKFLIRLPRKTLVLFIAAGGLFLAGSIGFEIIEGKYRDLHPYNNVTSALLYTIEELLEMLGVALLIYALLAYIEDQFGSLSINFDKQ